MTTQLDLLAPAAIEDEEPTPADAEVLAECEQFLFEGKPIEFAFETKVCEVNIIWDTLVAKFCKWAALYRALLRPLEDQLKALPPRARLTRAPVKAEIERLKSLGAVAEAMSYSAFEQAQCAFTEKLDTYWRSKGATDDTLECLYEAFWLSATSRPGIEHTWEWTLGRLADFELNYDA